jgi:hypothetical protein
VSATLVGQLRASRAPMLLAQDGAGAITLRVQVAEMWEAVKVVARPDTTVAEVKQRVVNEFFPGHEFLDDFVLKLRGWEMLDEQQSLSQAGVVEGAIVLLAYRRRRPVR